MLDSFKQYHDLGYSTIPLIEKRPAIEWKEYQTRRATLEEIKGWWRFNTGVVCGAVSGDLWAKDFDDVDLAREYYKQHSSLVRTIVETPRGIHFWFRRPGARNTQGDKQDDRGEGGYVVAPASVVNGKPYRFVDGFGLVPPEELCEWPVGLGDAGLGHRDGHNGRTVKYLESWLMQIESIQGSGGNRGLVRFIVHARDAGISQAKCMELLIHWNQSDRVQPPWSLSELSRAVENLYAK